MGREVRRVPLDFDWPQDKTWEGYLLPERLREDECPDCDAGFSLAAEAMLGQWYAHKPGAFDPLTTGSTPWTANTPEIRARAERSVEQSPAFYGRGEPAIRREAERLAALHNSWSHHLSPADTAALLKAGRLMDFTHEWDAERKRNVPIDPPPAVSAAAVNRWSLSGFGHDSLNCHIAIEARCEREGVPYLCSTCEGHGSREQYPGQRAEAEAWEPTEPPTGDGWQMWETTSEGSPMSPAFATPEELADWLASSGASLFGSNTADREQWFTIITGEDFAHVKLAPGVIIM